MLTRLALALAALASVAGCGSDDTAPLDWRYRFSSAGQRERTVWLDARILRGGCDTGAVQYRAGFVPGASSTELPPLLPRGRWGFDVWASDASCAPTGTGCSTVDLPTDSETLIVVLAELGAVDPACPAAMCMAGSCGDFDGGPPPVPDGGPMPVVDGGPIPSLDASPRDAGPPPCPTGTRDCDGDRADGCEVCPSVPHIAPDCYEGECVTYACETGWSDCDGIAENGCENDAPCMCPPTGPCVFDCTNGCTAICDRACTVNCGRCTTCEVSGPVVTEPPMLRCSPSISTTGAGRCEIYQTCQPEF